MSMVDDNHLGGKGFFFPDIVNKKYPIITNFLGIQKNNKEVLGLCLNDIREIEKELVNRAHKKVG